uniref:DUF3778 domain-containing protein n=1 Tax=Oryza barthii TaxID=65489 RepID=A0A0D3GKS4_9ORYZ
MAAAAVACRRGLLQRQQLWQAHRWVGPARSISQLVKTNGRRAFLVDTLALVRKLESQGVPTKQAEAITSAITEVLNDSLESISESFVSKAEMQKAEMLQESNISKFKSQVQSSQKGNLGCYPLLFCILVYWVLQIALRYEIDKVTAGQRLDLNLERGRIRDELAKQNEETTELTTKLDKEIHSLKAQLEAAKYDVIKYCIVEDGGGGAIEAGDGGGDKVVACDCDGDTDTTQGDGGGADPVRGGHGASDATRGDGDSADPVRSGGSGSVAARGDGGIADPVRSGGDGADAACGDSGGARAVSHAISFSTISIISAGQKLICSHSSAPSLKVGCSSDSPILLFPNRRNHVGFVIRVELGPPEQFRLIGLMLELLRFNDEPRGDPLLSPVTHTPKSTAQQQTSVLCRFRGGSRWGLTVCQADCTSFEAQGSSRRGFAADPCRLAPFSDVRLF